MKTFNNKTNDAYQSAFKGSVQEAETAGTLFGQIQIIYENGNPCSTQTNFLGMTLQPRRLRYLIFREID